MTRSVLFVLAAAALAGASCARGTTMMNRPLPSTGPEVGPTIGGPQAIGGGPAVETAKDIDVEEILHGDQATAEAANENLPAPLRDYLSWLERPEAEEPSPRAFAANGLERLAAALSVVRDPQRSLPSFHDALEAITLVSEDLEKPAPTIAAVAKDSAATKRALTIALQTVEQMSVLPSGATPKDLGVAIAHMRGALDGVDATRPIGFQHDALEAFFRAAGDAMKILSTKPGS